MKLPPLTTSLTAGAVAGILAIIPHQSSYAQATTFHCGVSDGVPATIADTPRGEVVVIRWVSENFNDSGYTPQRRCEEVSERFQTYGKQGILRYITTGIMNGQPTVCVAAVKDGACKGLLFTLKSNENANQVVQHLFAIRNRNAGPLNESSERYYLDFNVFLSSAPVQQRANTSRLESHPSPSSTSSRGSGLVW